MNLERVLERALIDASRHGSERLIVAVDGALVGAIRAGPGRARAGRLDGSPRPVRGALLRRAARSGANHAQPVGPEARVDRTPPAAPRERFRTVRTVRTVWTVSTPTQILRGGRDAGNVPPAGAVAESCECSASCRLVEDLTRLLQSLQRAPGWLGAARSISQVA